jgi:hypothetical protein
LRAFIIRPFGSKPDHTGAVVDFDAVERDLIEPALVKLGYEGRTTKEIAKAGNIREDMFRLLVTADLVIADISIHNANVFYELGIRHGLRDKRTFLVRCKADEPVFDLQTDRYLPYDRADPAGSLPDLVEALRQTRDAQTKDSPVFLLLPSLAVQERSLFLMVPQDFAEDVQRAKVEKSAGDLRLLAEEVGGFEWESEGLRVVGRAQFDLGAHEGGKVTWEKLRELEPNDLEANTSLGTIFQKLGDLARSDEAIQRALAGKDECPQPRAELRALLGRNAKARWLAEWQSKPEAERRETALRSPFLHESAKVYAAGFDEDLNHFYSGLNALAMATVEIELAGALPQIWEERFADSGEATVALDGNRKVAAQLGAAVARSLAAARRRLDRLGRSDMWLAISQADLRFLTSDRPQSVAASYRKALAGAPDFALESARTQLKLYQVLGVRSANAETALAVFPPESAAAAPAASGPAPRVLLFTGHRIDAPGRETPRFPAEKEDVARDAIKHAVETEMALPGGVAFGIAGAASGGDILFHEVCAELGIPTRLFLALPPDQYIVASVASAGASWIDRFHAIHDGHADARRVLSSSKELPVWLRGKRDYDIWRRNNLWTLHNALALGRNRVTLIALWDRGKGDGPGGTEHMCETTRSRGAKVVILDTKALFGVH